MIQLKVSAFLLSVILIISSISSFTVSSRFGWTLCGILFLAWLGLASRNSKLNQRGAPVKTFLIPQVFTIELSSKTIDELNRLYRPFTQARLSTEPEPLDFKLPRPKLPALKAESFLEPETTILSEEGEFESYANETPIDTPIPEGAANTVGNYGRWVNDFRILLDRKGYELDSNEETYRDYFNRGMSPSYAVEMEVKNR